MADEEETVVLILGAAVGKSTRIGAITKADLDELRKGVRGEAALWRGLPAETFHIPGRVSGELSIASVMFDGDALKEALMRQQEAIHRYQEASGNTVRNGKIFDSGGRYVADWDEGIEEAYCPPPETRDVDMQVSVSLDDAVFNDIHGWNSLLCEKTGEPELQDIEWHPVGVDGDEVVIQVTGYVEIEDE